MITLSTLLKLFLCEIKTYYIIIALSKTGLQREILLKIHSFEVSAVQWRRWWCDIVDVWQVLWIVRTVGMGDDWLGRAQWLYNELQ